MNAITMFETTAQRDAERIRENSTALLKAFMDLMNGAWPYLTEKQRNDALTAVEYATGAHDPDCYPEQGYEVDAAGTATGVSA